MASMHGLPPGITHPPRAGTSKPESEERRGHLATPGTLVLVFVFLAAFVLYYFTNWKLLSLLWKIG